MCLMPLFPLYSASIIIFPLSLFQFPLCSWLLILPLISAHYSISLQHAFNVAVIIKSTAVKVQICLRGPTRMRAGPLNCSHS